MQLQDNFIFASKQFSSSVSQLFKRRYKSKRSRKSHRVVKNMKYDPGVDYFQEICKI
jgi:hypothetical protein